MGRLGRSTTLGGMGEGRTSLRGVTERHRGSAPCCPGLVPDVEAATLLSPGFADSLAGGLGAAAPFALQTLPTGLRWPGCQVTPIAAGSKVRNANAVGLGAAVGAELGWTSIWVRRF